MSAILIGYRGSGKSSIGRRLAGRRGEHFIDTDDLIVAAAEKSIREIFFLEGEEKFRALESVAIHDALNRPACVIALGGGAILREKNREMLIESRRPRVYLKCNPNVLHRRIESDPQTAANRPALTKIGGGIDEIRALLEIREPLYREVMTIELDVSDLSIDDAVEKLIQLV